MKQKKNMRSRILRRHRRTTHTNLQNTIKKKNDTWKETTRHNECEEQTQDESY